MNTRTHIVAELAIFTAVAFIFSYLESLFPLPVPFPGIKLGFANLVIIILLYRDGLKAAFIVSMLRNILNALTFGSLFGFFYSLAGSVLSLLVMAFLKEKTPLSPVSVSAAGGILHNIGQFIIAVYLAGFSAILHYLPFLYFAGLAAGVLMGILASLCLERLPRQIGRSV